MYLDQDNWKGKVGRINILRRGNSLRLRFTYPAHNRIEITIAKAIGIGWQEIIRVANLVERDIQLEDFDDTLQRYGYKQTQSISVSSKKPNLKEIWESYKEANKNRVAPTTIKHCWHEMDRYFSLVPPSLLKTDKATESIERLLSIYKPSSLAGIFRASLYPAASQAGKQGILTRNVYRDIELPKTAKKKIECFEKFKIEAIIAAFYSNEYKPKKSAFLHSFYTPLVEFSCITGARPEEAHALTWDDIKRKKDKT